MTVFYFKFVFILASVLIFSSCSFSFEEKKWETLENSWTLNISGSSSGLLRVNSLSWKERNNIQTGTKKSLLTGIDEPEKNNCKKIFTEELEQKKCLNNFFIRKASVTKNSQECENITDLKSRDICKDNLLLGDILSKKDISLCSSFKSKEVMGICFANLGSSVNSQNQTGAIDPCMNISDWEIKIICNDAITMNQALFKSDNTLCEKIINEEKHSLCKNIVKSSSVIK